MTAKPKISQNQTILLVDDERALLGILTQVLENKGYEVVSAATPEAALLLARQHKGVIDLLISDMMLPGMSGAELAGNIAERQPGMAKLFISGEPNLRREVGNSHFLAKPFTIEAFADRVKSILKSLSNESVT